MPLKPPSTEITRMIRMRVPMDIWRFHQPGSQHLLLCHQPEKRTGTHKVPFLKHHKFTQLFFSNDLELHAVTLGKDSRMSAPLVVSIPHRLGREEAVRRLKAGLTRAASRIPVLKVRGGRGGEDRK